MSDVNADETRPDVTTVLTAAEFARWYWPVDALKAFCTLLEIPSTGTKAELRHRVAFALEHPGLAPPKPARKRGGSFNWAKEVLTRETVITEKISFGPNLRRFLASEIGPAFVCHSDFMDWVRSNAGATLGNAIDAWHMLEARKDDPAFRREIASCNNYLQYLRDARDAIPELSIEAAKACWDFKKIRPARDGMVIFEPTDPRRAGVL